MILNIPGRVVRIQRNRATRILVKRSRDEKPSSACCGIRCGTCASGPGFAGCLHPCGLSRYCCCERFSIEGLNRIGLLGVATAINDLIIVRVICFVVQSLLDRIPDNPVGSATYVCDADRIGKASRCDGQRSTSRPMDRSREWGNGLHRRKHEHLDHEQGIHHLISGGTSFVS